MLRAKRIGPVSVPVTQVAGLSPIVSATFFVSSPRRSPSVTFWPTLSGPERAQDRSYVADGLIIPGDDDVALVYTRLGAWSLRLDIHYHYTSFAALNCDMLETEAEIATRDVAVFLKSRRDTLNSSRRDNEDTPARSEHCHADCRAACVNSKTAFSTLPHAQIKFDPSIDFTAT